MIGDTYIFNPTTIADIHLSFLRWNYKRTPGTLGYDETKLGFPGYFSEIAQYNGFSPSTTVPSISMSNPTYNAVGTGLIFSINNNYVIAPTFTKILGRHTLKAEPICAGWRWRIFKIILPAASLLLTTCSPGRTLQVRAPPATRSHLSCWET